MLEFIIISPIFQLGEIYNRKPVLLRCPFYRQLSAKDLKPIGCHCAVPEEKTNYPPHGRSLEIPRGRGILKVNIFEAKYEAKLEFPRGNGSAKEKRSVPDKRRVLGQKPEKAGFLA